MENRKLKEKEINKKLNIIAGQMELQSRRVVNIKNRKIKLQYQDRLD